ncbi:hypothetical protein HETIRDRAFT_330664 [Heterobasidion irregulare TC 32-1]|uniref:Uncharacterized protein n=1 Tax=Heterobasidion irregulare (strain TC 32-1) TaxID=747525 RepID=W4JRB5_HETIT|nr:uncharacterized protein HETIRDRAFT_330664 [Heterobasidion irregulare TC 32-1]ETW75630.1 hypothetical protein HETIRDRAFT_330664 [Heterobasidion irregulare TC 32-1]
MSSKPRLAAACSAVPCHPPWSSGSAPHSSRCLTIDSEPIDAAVHKAMPRRSPRDSK